MARADQRSGACQCGRGQHYAFADEGVAAHELPLVLVEGAGLLENRSRDGRLADVMQPRGQTDPQHLVRGLAERLGDLAREL